MKVSRMTQKTSKGDLRTTSSSKSVKEDLPDSMSSSESAKLKHVGRCPFLIPLEIDLVQCILTLVCLATRVWRLQEPNVIVFDELHYGRYAQMYSLRTFFYDAQPPLGKMFLGAVASIAGFDPDFSFDKIGHGYLPSVPVWWLRFIPAVFGTLLTPVTYQIIVELNFSHWVAALASCLVIFENSLLTQSRFMLIDSSLLFFIALTLLSLLKFQKINKRSVFSVQWWFWLCMVSVSFTCAMCVKYVGFFTAVIALVLIGRDLWKILPDSTLSDLLLLKHAFARTLILVAGPVVMYIGVFYLHLSVLYKAGPHDDIMTSAFQASLEGGLTSITQGQPLHVVFGSQITLRRTHGHPCWLHSHTEVYPVRYHDGRGSSHQQQVTCYSFKDINNWWLVKDPEKTKIEVEHPIKPLKHGDVIQLVHGVTSRALNSHDVAAPVTANNQEVSCYIDYNVSMSAQNLWRVEIANRESVGDEWKTIQSYVRLVHVNTSQYLKTSGQLLPDWGFHQNEVVTDRTDTSERSLWNVEEHKYGKYTDDDEERLMDMKQTEMIPLEPTQLSFFTKFWELQKKMFTARHDATMEHRFSSEPIGWPFMDKNVAYWLSTKDHSQIHLMGNPVIWFTGTACVFMYAALFTFYMLRRRRLCYDIPYETWDQFCVTGELFFAGYLLNYVPFFTLDRTLFLHSYLPALYNKILLLAALVQHVHSLMSSVIARSIFSTLLVVWMTCAFNTFLTFSAISYGTTLETAEDVHKLEWRENWDFLVHRQLPQS